VWRSRNAIYADNRGGWRLGVFRGRRGVVRRPRQPSAQIAGGLGRGRPVERHQGRRAAGAAGNLGAPSIGPDEQDLDDVWPAVDGLAELNNVHEVLCASDKSYERATRLMILLSRRCGASEARCEDAPRLYEIVSLLRDVPKTFLR